MRFAHISDLHLCREPQGMHGLREDTPAIVEAVARDLTEISDSLDCVIVSGDLTEDAAEDSFAQFERLFAAIGVPVYTIPGNHDGPAAYHAQKARSEFLARADLTGQLRRIGGVRLFGLDTNLEGQATGAHDGADLRALSEALQAPEDSRLVIVMHHPPFRTGQADFDQITETTGAEDFAGAVRAAPRKPILLCGHVHRPYFAEFEGAMCFVGGTPTAPFVAARPFGDTPIRPSPEPYAYFVHQIDETGAHVATPRSVDIAGVKQAGRSHA